MDIAPVVLSVGAVGADPSSTIPLFINFFLNQVGNIQACFVFVCFFYSKDVVRGKEIKVTKRHKKLSKQKLRMTKSRHKES